MNNHLVSELETFLVEEYEARARQSGKYYDRALLARNIVNGILTMGFELPRTEVEAILEKKYGKSLRTKGRDLYEPMRQVILSEWQTMGDKNREVFDKGSRETIESFQLQVEGKERKRWFCR